MRPLAETGNSGERARLEVEMVELSWGRGNFEVPVEST